MTRKNPEPRKKAGPTPNAAKGRRVEKNQATRQAEIHDLGGALRKFGEGLKKSIEKRQAEQAFRHFSMPVEDQAVHSFSVPTSLVKPGKMVKHGDRLQWFWYEFGCTVIATLIMKDSPVPEDWGVKHGSRAGEWVVDVIGPNGSALFQLNADQAKVIGEHVLSAVYWRFAYLEYIDEYQEPETDGEVIQVYDKED
jgi:hypothetical protein